MIKNVFAIMVVTSLGWGCGQKTTMNFTGAAIIDTASSAIITPDSTQKVITPGKGVGDIAINGNVDKAIKALGKPDREDAGMGAAFMSWYYNHNPLNHKVQIYAHRNMGNTDEAIARVKKIVVTSPEYKTKDQISTGMTLSEISKQYELQLSQNPPIKGHYQVYHDLKDGISFEINPVNQICATIIIHAPGDASLTLINL